MTEIAINTLAFHGYSLDTALEEIAQLTDYVEPVYISKYDPTLCEEYFNENNAGMLLKQLERFHLKVVTMGSHMDLGQRGSVDRFKRRMEFAGAIGARMILTNAGRKSQASAFCRNIERLLAYAEGLGLVIALENPGDGRNQLLGTGVEGISILEKLGSDRIKLNYDCSNVFTYSQGKVRPEQELAALLPHIGHLHLKNVRPQGQTWMVCGIDEGIIDYRSLFRQFPALVSIPMSIELPLRFGFDAQFEFALREAHAAPPLERIRRALTGSLEYLSAIMPSAAQVKSMTTKQCHSAVLKV